MVEKRLKENESGAQGVVHDNPQSGHPTDQLVDMEGIKYDDVNKKPDLGGGFTPKGAETKEPMYEALEGGDDYLEAILSKLEELEKRLSDIEGGSEEIAEEIPMEEPPMEEPPMVEERFNEKKNAQRERIENTAKRVFAPKRKVERKMTTRISTVPVGHSARNEKVNLTEFLHEVKAETKRL